MDIYFSMKVSNLLLILLTCAVIFVSIADMTEDNTRENQGPIYGCSIDYYDRYVALAGADQVIIIRKLLSDSTGNTEEILVGHDGPVWCTEWSHPQFGNRLASASYDSKIIIWSKQTDEEKFSIEHINTSHTGSVNSISWAPRELGLRLGSVSSDGAIREIFHDGKEWTESIFVGSHSLGGLCVSWFPEVIQVNNSKYGILCTGGCDAKVKLWLYNLAEKSWNLIYTCSAQDWVRHVAFAPLPAKCGEIVLAVALQEKKVQILKFGSEAVTEIVNSLVDAQISCEKNELETLDVPWKLSWSPVENKLCVALADSSIFKYNLGGDCLEKINP